MNGCVLEVVKVRSDGVAEKVLLKCSDQLAPRVERVGSRTLRVA